MDFVIASNNKIVEGVKNEEIESFEIGYSVKSSMFSANINGYYTIWNNRPVRVTLTDPANPGDPISSYASGMSALHKGVELDFAFRPIKVLTFEGMVSLGDWEWTKAATAILFDQTGNEVARAKFDPTGVKVGDAAQFTYAASLRYEPIKGVYIKPQFNYFSKNYSNYSPEALVVTNFENNFGPNIGRQSWRLPDYGMVDLSCGYAFFNNNHKYDFRASVQNILDSFYITDAQDNGYGTGQTFSVQSANVNVGLGRRWVFSVTATF
jgi:outer membrane receptor protein involved in Fe transport